MGLLHVAVIFLVEVSVANLMLMRRATMREDKAADRQAGHSTDPLLPRGLRAAAKPL